MEGNLKGKCRRFTLLELLAVVAIIAILMAIALPVLNSAKEKSVKMTCIGNLRQIGVLLNGYCDDYNGRIPPNSPNGYTGFPFSSLRNSYGKLYGFGVFVDNSNAACFGCPSSKDLTPAVVRGKWLAGQRVVSSYVYRETFNNFGFIYSKNPCNLSVAIDWDSPPDYRAHYGKWINALRQDGSVKGKSNLDSSFTYPSGDPTRAEEAKVWDCADAL